LENFQNFNTHAKLIISHHDSEKTPDLYELENTYLRAKKLGADIVKIVTTATSINDNFVIFELLKNKKDLISFCMGIKGQISRILAPKYGSFLSYCSLDGQAAPGQLSLEDMKVLSFDSINSKTKVFGVIGEHAENSLSKYMHNPGFKEHKTNAVYVPFKVNSDELEEFIKHHRREFSGGSVTTPHKQKIIKFLDEVDENVKQIGACNTISRMNERFIGSNTDFIGAVESLKEETQLQNKKILVIGAGGAARAIIFGLKKEEALLTVVNRNQEKAQQLADEFNIRSGTWNELNALVQENDIIINATSIGMNPEPDNCLLNELPKGKLVMDIIYSPTETKLIALARKSECKVITGERMLIHQALGQFELWTGQKANFNLFEKNLVRKLEAK